MSVCSRIVLGPRPDLKFTREVGDAGVVVLFDVWAMVGAGWHLSQRVFVTPHSISHGLFALLIGKDEVSYKPSV